MAGATSNTLDTGATVRVAAVQFQVGADVEANLATSLRMLDEAARHRPQLIVLPEFCNHLSWYSDKAHCYQVSVALDSPFLQAIAQKAKAIGAYVVVNCTVARADGSATGSSLCYGPDGNLLADNTKQIYIGHENDFLEKAREPGPIISLPIGRLGFYACMDGVINETPRGLALRGAQILCNSLNSFASDEGSLHIPVRAAENKVFVIAANKVGPLVPAELVQGISQATGIPEKFLNGAGESQIVAPDGRVLARASLDQEEVIVADICPADADCKNRPDGTDIFISRRPALYRAIGEDPAQQPLPSSVGKTPVQAAVLAPAALPELLAELRRLLADGIELITLPPQSEPQACAQITVLCSDYPRAIVATACRTEQGYQAMLLGAQGPLLTQSLVHNSARFGAAATDAFNVLDTAHGRLAVVAGDDSIYPESFRLLAMQGVEIALVPLSPSEHWELQTGLLERAAENRINLLVAADNLQFGASFAAVCQEDFTVMTPWQSRPFDGLLSQPEWHRLAPGAASVRVPLKPWVCANKEVSRNTDLLAGRPWQLCGAIVAH